MAKTIRTNPEGNIEIASKAWSDFAATIPIIRSFSYGNNFPPQYPIFAGPRIRYHFVFFLLTAVLEKIGLSLTLALNLLSALSFFLLLTFIYLLAKELFNKESVAILSIILFLFNGSLSFLEFFKQHPLSANTPSEIVRNSTFASFGPYDGKIVSAFWNLNIYTNQRHLALAYASFLILIFIIYKYQNSPQKITPLGTVLLGICIGLFPFIHLAVFGMLGIVLITTFLLYPKLRSKILIVALIAMVLAAPQILYMGKAQVDIKIFNPGYLIENLSMTNFFNYWLLNLGLTIILLPLALIISNKKQGKIYVAFFILFIVGNFFQFSVELAANHKFFNLFLIGTNIYIANLLIYLWNKKSIIKLAVPFLLFFLTLSGIIDLFPVFNDEYFEIEDYPQNATVSFIVANTPKDSVFLNAQFLHDPATLAGRKIYLGWPYFSWSAGYDTDSRFAKMKSLLAPNSKKVSCSSLVDENIDYVEIQKPTFLEEVTINYSFFENNFAKIHQDPKTNISIYDVSLSCQ